MPGKHVLAFEADPIYGELLRKELEARSISLVIVTDANEGLEKAASTGPDLIYLCAELPRTSGFSVCYKLRKNAATQAIPVIITSAEATEETIEKHKQLQNLRADEYVQKPFGIEVIRALFDQYLGNADGSLELEMEEIEGEVVRDDEMSFEAVAVADDLTLGLEELEELEEIVPADASVADKVDEDVDSFANFAFDSIIEEQLPDPQPGALPKTLSVPPQSRQSYGPNDSPTELDRLRQTNTVLERQVSKLEQDVIEAKASKGGGTSSRELLELREMLNKKDRLLLDIKDAANKKEKQILELHERLNDVERTRADLADRALGFEKKIADLSDKVRAQDADKDVLAKKADDLQHRLGKTQETLAGRELELNQERQARRDDKERSDAEKAELLKRAAAEQSNALVELSVEKDNELDSALKSLRAEFDATAAEVARAHSAVIDDWDRRVERGRARIVSLESTLEQVQNEKAETQGLLDQANQESKALRIELNDAKQRIENQSAELGGLRIKLQESEKDGDDLRFHISERDERIEALLADLSATSDVLAHNEEIVSKTRQALSIAAQLLDQIEIIETLSPVEEV